MPDITHCDTIYALASAMGRAGVAVVRVSGNMAIPVVNAVVKNRDIKTFSPRTMQMVHIVNPVDGSDIDYGVAVVFPAPHSFTGESVVELHCHGSRAILNALYPALEHAGARLAEPGEFSKQAFANGKMDLTEAEGLVDLINAETHMQMQQAHLQSQGAMGKCYTQWANTILPILAHYEAYIDFPDEDLPPDVEQHAFDKIDGLIVDMQRHLESGSISERIRTGIQVAVIGEPNAGKSSLVNTLANREVAIVSSTAGTTRDVIEVNMDIGGYAVRIFDTAGLRPTSDYIETEGIKRAIHSANTSDILVLVADGSSVQVNQTYIQQKLENIQNSCVEVIVLCNKSDKSDFIPPPEAKNIFSVSLLTEQGLDGFISYLQGVILNRFRVQSDPIITRHRHRVALQACIQYLTQAKSAPVIELVAEDLRQAVRSIGKITGQVAVEEILDIVFADFCIGK